MNGQRGYELTGATILPPLDEVDLDILDYIQNMRDELGFSPTIREISEHVDRVLSVTHRRVMRMVSRGFLVHSATLSRTIVLTETGLQAMREASERRAA